MLLTLLDPRNLRRPHPRLSDRTRTFLATLTFVELLAGYIILVIAACFIGGFALWMAAPSKIGIGFWQSIEATFFTLVGIPPNSVDSSHATGAYKFVIGSIGLGSILLPAVFLGAIVFRLFVRERIFVFRKRPSLVQRDLKGEKATWFIAVRLYPTSRLLVIDVSFRVYFQHRDKKRSLLTNQPVRLFNSDWPVANTHVPFTIYLPLDDDDVSTEGELLGVQSTEMVAGSTLIIHVRGTAPQLGTDLSEVHYVSIPVDLKPGDFHDIDVLYDGNGPKWSGWDKFEEEAHQT